MNVLVVNAGSSSLKYQLFDTSDYTVKAKGICERIGDEMGVLDHKNLVKGTRTQTEMKIPTHTDAVRIVISALTDPETGVIADMSEIEAVGHRIVHGGFYFSESVLLSDDVMSKLELCHDFAPLHTGAHLQGIRGCLSVMPGVPQVLVFDTAFHQTMEPEAYMYALPYEMYEKYHIRRYGAHGTSHRYVSGEMIRLLGGKAEGTKIITCHIGNGSSISAVKDGKVIDTSMGFTPLAGVLMGTRCGNIDPAIVPYIMEKENMSPAEVSAFMNKKCGYIGLTKGFSSDSRDLENAIAHGPSDPNYELSNLAVNMLKHELKEYIGAYTALMNGLDALVFTAGLGENNPRLRKIVCEDMDFFGIKLNDEVNDRTLRQPNIVKISADDSKVPVYVIPTDEELVIARDTESIVNSLAK
ncbi:MAG: acetate kinase [Eubacteriales bacterium]|nr:acetate kinase [Clostridiales bacterium]MDD7595136.1 acetate kinase [Clostridiales bacterium]MDY4887625.1 acetate kinase [Eubacteriales bacterium]HCG67533.1 acetate kinase [Clostridiales bacterium]